MRLVRHGEPGRERPGMLDEAGGRRDLSEVIPDLDAARLAPHVLQRLRLVDVAGLPRVPDEVRWAPCVAGVGNIVCIGLNYADHAREAGLPLPVEPIVFSKHASALSGPFDPVWLPPGADRLDWEVELGVVIGRTAWHVNEADALGHVAGYCLLNDISERSSQLERGGQWIKGKSYPSHCPIGPWLLTADEVPDPQAIDLWLDVNGQPRQRGSSATMIFPVAHIIAYLSRFMALQPGDLIATGTPPGVGMGARPPVYLQLGDSMRLGGLALGEQRQTVQAAPVPT